MRREVAINMQEEYIERLKSLAGEQDVYVDNLINILLEKHFSKKLVCIEDFEKSIKTKKIQYKDSIFEANRFEDLDSAVRFYNDDKEVFYIEHEFFELARKGDITELIALSNRDYYYDLKYGLVKAIK